MHTDAFPIATYWLCSLSVKFVLPVDIHAVYIPFSCFPIQLPQIKPNNAHTHTHTHTQLALSLHRAFCSLFTQ